MLSKKPSSLFRNAISYFGILIFSLSTVIGLSMMFSDILGKRTNPYAGILTYLVLPIIAGMGGVIAMGGVLWERRRRRLHPQEVVPPLPQIDLNKSRHKIILAGSLGLILVVIVLLSVTGYQAYNFSDSVEFCGLACHTVMEPEYTAYQYSPHARVLCAECHIGPGANWFIKSKISGSYQVYSAAFKKYSRPIETPVKNLRPAQETCEQCHWPAKFFGARQKTFTHYLTDENNSAWQIKTLLKIGGGNPDVGASSGIHWHMNIKNEINYVDLKGKREVIPWVRSISPDGKIKEFMSVENPLTPKELAERTVRKMDCIDCHNRPSHVFHTPNEALDHAFDAGLLDPSLTFLKREGMKLLAGEYKTKKEALEAILKGLPEYYKSDYPKLSREKSALILKATRTIKTLFSINIFPAMKTNWASHPNHTGHLISDGCFRCHDGLHKSQEGELITNDCNTCHTILAQGPPEKVANAPLKAQTFEHPVALGFDVTEMKCSECHTGTTGL